MRETASGRRQAPLNVTSSLDAARELGIRDAHGLRARSPAGQGSEVVLGCEILNRMTALGRPVSYRIGR